MNLNEITNKNEPYLEVLDGNEYIRIPIKVMEPIKLSMLASVRANYIIFDLVKIGDRDALRLLEKAYKQFQISLICSTGGEAYRWTNVKVASVMQNRKRYHCVLVRGNEGTRYDRRKFNRFAIDTPCTIITPSERIACNASDISYDGLGLKSFGYKILLKEEDAVTVRFEDYNKEIDAVVKRVFKTMNGENVIGLHFKDSFIMKMFVKKVVKDYCRENIEEIS